MRDAACRVVVRMWTATRRAGRTYIEAGGDVEQGEEGEAEPAPLVDSVGDAAVVNGGLVGLEGRGVVWAAAAVYRLQARSLCIVCGGHVAAGRPANAGTAGLYSRVTLEQAHQPARLIAPRRMTMTVRCSAMRCESRGEEAAPGKTTENKTRQVKTGPGNLAERWGRGR